MCLRKKGPSDRGTQVNVSGAGVVRSSSNKAMELRFMEYLSSQRAQALIANRNFEYPVVAGVAPHPALTALGSFRADQLNAQRYGALAPEALTIIQRAGCPSGRSPKLSYVSAPFHSSRLLRVSAVPAKRPTRPHPHTTGCTAY